MSEHSPVGRRNFLKSIGAAAATGAVVADAMSAGPAIAQTPPISPLPLPMNMAPPVAAPPNLPAEVLHFFTATEIDTITAIVDTLIPADEVGPGGVEAGVVTFLDRELAGAYGRGDRLYLQGPFGEGTPEQGYQLALTPGELYRVGLADFTAWIARTHERKNFEQLTLNQRADALKAVENGSAEFAQVPPRTFFEILLATVMEGYFSDPIYGGNRDLAVWKMIGFPGAEAMYADVIESSRNKRYTAVPKGIADLS